MELLKKYYMPDFLYDIKEVKATLEIAEYIAELFLNKLKEMEKESDTATASITGIERKEKSYGIEPYETDTLEERRFRIAILEKEINIYNFNEIKKLIQMITSTSAAVSRDFSDTTQPKLTVDVPLSSEKSFKEMTERVKEMIPVDMLLVAKVLYHKFSEYENSTFNECKSMTFNEMRAKGD